MILIEATFLVIYQEDDYSRIFLKGKVEKILIYSRYRSFSMMYLLNQAKEVEGYLPDFKVNFRVEHLVSVEPRQ